jgi:hypothetical protein
MTHTASNSRRFKVFTGFVIVGLTASAGVIGTKAFVGKEENSWRRIFRKKIKNFVSIYIFSY